MAEDDGLEEVKLAIVKLTTIQEIQLEQVKALIENGKVTLVIAETSKEHSKQILDLYNKHNVTKDDLNEKLTDMRASLNRASYSRLIFAITVSVGLSWELFGLANTDIQSILKTKEVVQRDIAVLKKDVKHIHEHIQKEQNEKNSN